MYYKKVNVGTSMPLFDRQLNQVVAVFTDSWEFVSRGDRVFVPCRDSGAIGDHEYVANAFDTFDVAQKYAGMSSKYDVTLVVNDEGHRGLLVMFAPVRQFASK